MAKFYVINTKAQVLRFGKLSAAKRTLRLTPHSPVLIQKEEDLMQLPLETLATIYNKVSAIKIKRFSTKPLGASRLWPLIDEVAVAGDETTAGRNAIGSEKGGGGRPSRLAGKTITRTRRDNPREPNSLGYRAWECIEDGMTVGEYREKLNKKGIAGGLKHLRHDEKRGWVTVER